MEKYVKVLKDDHLSILPFRSDLFFRLSLWFTIIHFLILAEKYWEMCSFSESVARRLGQSVPEEFISYNKRFLSRIYPAGKRVDSSNFNPQEFWNCGCQLGELVIK